MLKFDPAWRFDSPGRISNGVIGDFEELIRKVAAQTSRKAILEHFKKYFAGAAGIPAYWSSSESWAETDLNSNMLAAAENGPLFIEAFYDACEALRSERSDLAIPEVSRMNRALSDNNAGYEIHPPDLLSTGHSGPLIALEQTTSLDQKALNLIQESLSKSEKFLFEGQERRAVQEIVWLLETISTAFKGIDIGTGTIQGKYFNKIVNELRANNRGKALDQILGWITALHGYLSSPTGGGIRHGADLKEGSTIQPNEARLYCNLIRSYIYFLLSEHERLSNS